MKRSRKAVVGIVVVALVILGGLLEAGRVYYTWRQHEDRKQGYTIVIDPGHGGRCDGPKIRYKKY